MHHRPSVISFQRTTAWESLTNRPVACFQIRLTLSRVTIPIEILLLLDLARHCLGIRRLGLGTPSGRGLVAVLVLVDVREQNLLLVAVLGDCSCALCIPIRTLALGEIPLQNLAVSTGLLSGAFFPPGEVSDELLFRHHVFFDDFFVNRLGLGARSRCRHLPADRARCRGVGDRGIAHEFVAAAGPVVDRAWNQAICTCQRQRWSVLLPHQGRAIDLYRPAGLLAHVPISVGRDDGVVTLTGRHHRINKGRHGVVDAVALACVVTTHASQRFTCRRGAACLDVLNGREPLNLVSPAKILEWNKLGVLVVAIARIRFGYGQKAHPEVVTQRGKCQANGRLGHVDACTVVAVPDRKVLLLGCWNDGANPISSGRRRRRTRSSHARDGRALLKASVVHLNGVDARFIARTGGFCRVLEMRCRPSGDCGVRNPFKSVGRLGLVVIEVATTRIPIVSLEASAQIDRSQRRVVAILPRCRKDGLRHIRSIRGLGQAVGGVRVVVERVAQCALVAHREIGRRVAFPFIGHVRPLHRFRCIEQQHHIGLVLIGVGGHRDVGDVHRFGTHRSRQCNTAADQARQSGRHAYWSQPTRFPRTLLLVRSILVCA